MNVLLIYPQNANRKTCLSLNYFHYFLYRQKVAKNLLILQGDSRRWRDRG
jgi:hypothetical protein